MLEDRLPPGFAATELRVAPGLLAGDAEVFGERVNSGGVLARVTDEDAHTDPSITMT